MNRLGDVFTLKNMTIALLVLVLLIPTSLKAADFFSGSGDIVKCQGSIVAAHLAKGSTKGLEATDLKCNDLRDTIIDDKVLTRGEISDSKLKKELADTMVNCWRMVGRGEVDPFKDYEGDKTYCLLCSDVIFEEDIIQQAENEGYVLKDFPYWLATTNLPGKKESYFESLHGFKPDTLTVQNTFSEGTPFDLNDQYVIIWRLEALKKDLWETVTFVGSSAGAGAAAGTFIPGVGNAIGGIIGFGVGMYGAIWASNNVFEDLVVNNGIYIVPKKVLGETFIIQTEDEKIEKPFCTQLVNF